MKKILSAVIAAITVFAICAFVAGCSSDVSGKTYAYSAIEYDADIVTAEDNARYDELWIIYADYLTTVSFGTDGTVTFGERTGSYEQDGSKISMTFEGSKEQAVIKGKTLVLEKSLAGFSFGSLDFEICYDLK